VATATVRVRGLRELQRDFKKMGGGLNKDIDRELRQAGQIVADEARSRFAGISAASAAGFRPRTRGFGRVVVEQRKGRTTGLRGDYGALQMRRALLPALGAKQDEVVKALDQMLGHLGGENGF
jgi:hypothetical protein